jgi:hypothetical protein
VDDRVWENMLFKGSNDAAELADKEDAVHVSHGGLDQGYSDHPVAQKTMNWPSTKKVPKDSIHQLPKLDPKTAPGCVVLYSLHRVTWLY